jgi:hypothetical protein
MRARKTKTQEVTPVTAQRPTARTGGRGGRAPGAAVGWAVMLAILAIALTSSPEAHVHALNAAGAFKGEAIGGVSNFVDKLKGNLVWLGGTAMGLVIAVVGIMFMAGHSRAHDLAIRTIVGLAILASISGIIA